MATKPTCEECGAELPANAPQGLCPRCLANMGLGLLPAASTAMSDIQVEHTGAMIGRYKLLEKIGEGGFGVVFMAEQVEPVQRKVALKIIKAGMDTKEVIARFEAERQAIALMDHPNIARALDAGTTEAGRPFFVMELVRGIPITDYCDQHHLPTRERLDLFIKVCQAVQHAHQKGVIHRDIKPSNVLVTEHDGEPVPKVIDFGVAKALGQKLTAKTLFTAFHHLIGTPAYMSPEQAALSGLDIDTRADVYSLGVLLYELLTGVTPFDTETFRTAAMDEIRRMIREAEPPKPSTRLQTLGAKLNEVAKCRRTDPAALSQLVRGDLDWIVMRCLDKDRKRRYETANGLGRDIERHIANETVLARPPNPAYQMQRFVRRHKVAFTTLTTIAMVLVLAAVVSTWQALRATRAEREQNRLRLKAEGQTAMASREASRAEAAAIEAKMTLATSDFLQAVHLIAEDNGGDALAYLVRSLSSNPTNAGALTRLATLLTHRSWMLPRLSLKHDQQVSTAEFSADGKQVVTISGNTARIWDAQTGRRLVEFSAPGKEIHAGQFSPDGKRIATLSEGTVGLWDAQSGQPLGALLKHDRRVNSVCFSSDGKRIVTGTGEKDRHWQSNVAAPEDTARVWDVQTAQPVTVPSKHNGKVNSVQFSLDGKRFVTASDDESVCVWNAETGHLLAGPLKHDGKVMSAEFSPDGQRIVAVSWWNKASVWDAKGGVLLTDGLKHKSMILSAQFSPDGKRIVTCSEDSTARVWDAQSGQPLTQPLAHSGEVNSARFSPDGKLIFTISTDYTVLDDKTYRWCRTARVWDARTGQPVTETLNHGNDVWSAQFSPDGKRIVTTSSDNAAWLWNAQTGPALTQRLSHSSSVKSAQFTSDGKRILTASVDGTVWVWDATSGGLLAQPLRQGGTMWSAQFSLDGLRIVTAYSNGTARVWNAQNGQPLTDPLRHDDEVRSAQFSPDGKRIVTASDDKTARVWDAQTGQPLTEPLRHNGLVFSAQFSPDGKLIVTVSWGAARVWDAQSGRLMSEPVTGSDRLYSAQFAPDSREIVTASAGGSARVWDARSGQPVTGPLKHGGEVAMAQFSPDGKRIVTISDDRTARVWDARTGRPLTEPLRHGFLAHLAQFSPDGRRIVTAAMNSTTRVWDVESGQPLTESLELYSDISSAQLSPDGKRIVMADGGDAVWSSTGGADGPDTVRVWDIAPSQTACPAWLPELAEAISGKVLNKQNVLEETKLARIETLDRIRKQLDEESNNDDWVLWGRWFLADPSTRTISPFCSITVPEYIENRIKEHTADSLAEAEELASGNPELLQRIAQARKSLEQTK